MASASAPSTPTRSASCGVKRYGSVDARVGRQEAPRRRAALGNELAKEPHLGARGRRRRRAAARPRHKRVDRRGEEQVQGEAGQERLEERAPRRHVLAEQEVEAEAREGDERS